MGPVINERAKTSILKYIDTGKSEGRLVAGGEAGPGDGYFIKPTVIADIGSKARIFQEEIFGPVLAITKAKDFDHALELANDSEYGLTGAVFTDNPAKIEKAKEKFFVGQSVHQQEVHGSDGRGASVRRFQYVRDRFEGGRTGLPAAVRTSQIDRRKGGEPFRSILKIPRQFRGQLSYNSRIDYDRRDQREPKGSLFAFEAQSLTSRRPRTCPIFGHNVHN